MKQEQRCRESPYRAVVRTRLGSDVLREGQEHKLVIGSLYAPEDMLKDPHFKARDFFVEVEEKDGTKATYPGAPCLFSSFGPVPRKAAPSLGEHTQDVLGAQAAGN